MPSYSTIIYTFTIITAVTALPTPQLAGEGAAANSILSSTDNGVGFGIKNAEDNLAANVKSIKPANRRQLAGEGAAANSLFSSTDNGVGFGIENAEDNLAGDVTTLKGGAPARKERRQADKIAKGAQTLSNAAGTGAATSKTTTALVNVDGDLTSGAANTGADVGKTEESTLEDIGSGVPKTRRQLDKISNGAQDLSNALGTGAETSTLTTAGDNVDGELTSGAANAGAMVGNTEESTLEGVGNAVPKL